MIYLCAVLLFFTSLVYADNFYYCANTNQGVSVGENITQVFTACGAPTTMSTQQQLVPTVNTAAQWVYTTGTAKITAQGIVPPANAPSLIFTIQNGVVTQIQRSGAIMSSNLGCDMAQAIGVNSTAAAVRLVCGNPTYIQPASGTNSIQHTSTTWIYNHGPFQPQIIFTFTDGKLMNIKSGQLGS
jgi:hypothetical protein